MKRENNFRVWCKDYQEWKKDYCFLSQDGQVYQMMKNGQIRAIRPENHVVQFFTGLFDKNSLPIFEGDILRVQGWRGYITTAVMEWQETEASDDMGVNTVGYRRFDEYGKPEIIGNIFEPPDLLNK